MNGTRARLAALTWAASAFLALALLAGCAASAPPQASTPQAAPGLERVPGDGGPFGHTMHDWQRREARP